MAGPAIAETKENLRFNPNIRQFDDTVTWLAEVLDGQMKSEFTYSFDGKNLIARDGGNLGEVFSNAIIDAESKAKSDPRYNFELRRRKIEAEEYEDIIAMAREDLGHNTIVVISDFPKEIDELGEDFGGYNLNRRQTMLRVITKNVDGTLTMSSQSLDRSDHGALQAIYRFFGITPGYGELLGQRIYANIKPENSRDLSDTLTKTYDNQMALQYGGEWFAGRSGNDRRNTMEFATNQADLIEFYLSVSDQNALKYNLSASITARFEGADLGEPSCLLGSVVDLDSSSRLYEEMRYHGLRAMQAGKRFNGCGGTLSAEAEMIQSGYGDNDKKHEKQDWYGRYKKNGTCVNCSKETEVGEKSWCKVCIKGHCG